MILGSGVSNIMLFEHTIVVAAEQEVIVIVADVFRMSFEEVFLITVRTSVHVVFVEAPANSVETALAFAAFGMGA